MTDTEIVESLKRDLGAKVLELTNPAAAGSSSPSRPRTSSRP